MYAESSEDSTKYAKVLSENMGLPKHALHSAGILKTLEEPESTMKAIKSLQALIQRKNHSTRQ